MSFINHQAERCPNPPPLPPRQAAADGETIEPELVLGPLGPLVHRELGWEDTAHPLQEPGGGEAPVYRVQRRGKESPDPPPEGNGCGNNPPGPTVPPAVPAPVAPDE